ncbi:hypothetical protein [Robertmurraya sp. FSL R5-0851]|uniref:hypothetical protein n=1 Tax=Robertmurraya sp. FSL R5-0851 TaxID=2921584 RepID=UPI0030F5B8D6
MQTRDDLYQHQYSLNTLMLLKVAYDAGINMNVFSDYAISSSFEDYNDLSIFLRAIEEVVEICELYSSYDKDDEEEIKYWCNQASYDNHLYSTTNIIVLLDDQINRFENRGFGGGYNINQWYVGYGEIVHFDKGILIVYDEEDGAVDWADPLYIICEDILAKISVEEGESYEMAV